MINNKSVVENHLLNYFLFLYIYLMLYFRLLIENITNYDAYLQ